MNKTIKSRNKKNKVWFGSFPENAGNMDLCITKECGTDGSLDMYYMVYINTPFNIPLEKVFICLKRIKDREILEENLGIKFPKGF